MKEIQLRDLFKNRISLQRLKTFIIVSVIIELICYFSWTSLLRNENYYSSRNIEYHLLRIIEFIISYILPCIVSLIGVILTRYKYSGIFGVIASSPFVIGYSCLINKSVIQAHETIYWFFVPTVFVTYLIQILVGIFAGLIFSIIVETYFQYKGYSEMYKKK